MDLQELSQWMKERNLKGHWEHSEWSQSVKPYLWKGEEIMQALNWSGELITTGEAGRGRRGASAHRGGGPFYRQRHTQSLHDR